MCASGKINAACLNTTYHTNLQYKYQLLTQSKLQVSGMFIKWDRAHVFHHHDFLSPVATLQRLVTYASHSCFMASAQLCSSCPLFFVTSGTENGLYHIQEMEDSINAILLNSLYSDTICVKKGDLCNH